MNSYRKISLSNNEIVVPNVPLREEVEVHLIPDVEKGCIRGANMVGKPNGAAGYLPAEGVPKSSLLNFTTIHFSTFPNIDFL